MARTIGADSGQISLNSANAGYNPLTVLANITVANPVAPAAIYGIYADGSQNWTIVNLGTIQAATGNSGSPAPGFSARCADGVQCWTPVGGCRIHWQSCPSSA